jgi:hypothetical protein
VSGFHFLHPSLLNGSVSVIYLFFSDYMSMNVKLLLFTAGFYPAEFLKFFSISGLSYTALVWARAK